MAMIRELAALVSLISSVIAFMPCPILGPVFAVPQNLQQDDTFQKALVSLQSSLKSAADSRTTAFGAFSSAENSFSIEALKSENQGTKVVDGDSIYRIGSVSKLITAYLFLVQAGPQYWIDPITKYIPELQRASNGCNSSFNAISCIDWNTITLGALADHLADVPRDYSGPGELLAQPLSFTQYGFSSVPASDTPKCNLQLTEPCSTKSYLDHLAKGSPTEGPFTTALYADAGYALLGIALDRITGRNILQSIASELFEVLGMTSSNYSAPTNLSNAALPGGPIKSGFTVDLSSETPTGGNYSSQNDFIRLGRSILSFSLLSPAVTREWMKTNAFVSAKNQGVGKPWENWRESTLSGHVVDVYTKSGDVFAYAALLILVPEYDLSLVIMAADNESTNVVEYVADAAAASILPALEIAAQQQADSTFTGVYESTYKKLNSSISLNTRPGQPGLLVESWISNGTNFLDVVAQLEGTEGAVDIRLYPTSLAQWKSPNVQQVEYRAVLQPVNTRADGGIL